MATAQQPPSRQATDLRSSLADILRDIHPGSSRGNDPVWGGQAQFNPLPGAKARVQAGERKAGEAFAEIDVGPARTGTLDADVALDHPTHGQLKLAKGTPLKAVQHGMAGGSGSDLKMISEWIAWCTVESADGRWICIDHSDGVTAKFEESQTTPNGLGLSQRTGRRWTGPVPKIVETTGAPETPTVRRLKIASIADEGVMLEMDSKAGDRIWAGRGMGRIKWETAVRDRERFPGLIVMFRRGASPETAIVVIGPEDRQ